MTSQSALLNEVQKIYAAAHASEDGRRCAVAPHPDLRERINEAIRAARDAGGLPAALSLRAAEPKVYGLNDGTIYPPEEYPLGTSPSVIRAAALERAPLRGTLRVIVVLVDFSDKHMTQTQNHFRDLFFSTGVIPTKSVREYYRDVTNGLIDIQGDVVGPFRLPQTLAAYAHGASGLGQAQPNAQTMAHDAAVAANPSVNFTPYDNDGNGYVDAFIVIHAGQGAEVTGGSGDIWSHKWVISGGAMHVDNTKIYGYLTVPEDSKIGVCAHELGHLLFGFPDLYDTDGSSEGIGNWCLMAAGSWGGGGDTPVHPSAWCKANQGWVSIDVRTTNAIVNIADVKTSHTVYRLWKDGTSGNEYFLVENRERTGFDTSLPGPGLLIWHIDEAQPGNTDERHYKVALMQADGHRDLELNHNRGDGGDCYPGSSSNTAFNNSSNPNSKSYANANTCVAVTGISAPGAVMTANLQVKCVVKTKEIKDTKEIIKDKEIRKEIKEKDIKDKDKDIKDKEKEAKEKETKEIKEGKEIKEKEKEKDKEIKEIKEGKEIKEIDKPVGEGRPGGGLGRASAMASLEARVAALEAALGAAPPAAQGEPFIGNELRPDLSQGAFMAEEDVAHLQEQMRMGSGHAKRVYDSKIDNR